MLTFSFSSFSQNTAYVGQSETVTYEKAEIKPEFLGGYNAFLRYISENFKSPEVEGLSGTIKMSFVIEINGRVSSVKIVNDIGEGAGAEAARVLKASPIWSPGEIEGVRVRVKMELPIKINN